MVASARDAAPVLSVLPALVGEPRSVALSGMLGRPAEQAERRRRDGLRYAGGIGRLATAPMIAGPEFPAMLAGVLAWMAVVLSAYVSGRLAVALFDLIASF